MRKLLQLAILIFLPGISFAQEIKWIKQDSLYKYIQPFAVVQMWSTYTMGEKARLVSRRAFRTCS